MLKFNLQLLLEIAQLFLWLAAILVGRHKLKNQRITLTPEASQSFAESEQIFTDAVELPHLRPSAPLQLKLFALKDAVCTTFYQVVDDIAQLIDFLDTKRSQTPSRYSTFGRKL